MAEIKPSSSQRQILRATAIVGGASAINIVVGLVRNKATALLLGPAGLGTMGLLLSLVMTVSGVGGLGVGNAAVRQIASDGDPVARSINRRALERLTIVLALISALATWLLRWPLAKIVLGDDRLAWQVGWLAPAVGITIWGAGQGAVLNGLRRLRDLAAVQVLGGLLGTALGIAALAAWGMGGILAYVIAAPLGVAVIGAWFVGRLERPLPVAGGARHAMASMLQLGVPMMTGGIMLSAGALAIRSLIGTRIGAVELGSFTAAWTLSVTYVGFVLGAMGTDYLPRLTAVIADREAAGRSINEQAEVAMLLAFPVMLAMQAAAPWIIWLLYSRAFSGAVEVLRWLIVADVMKTAAWPLGYAVVAQARAKTFLAIETATLGVTLIVVDLLVDRLGIQAAGVGYCVSYVFYIGIVGGLAHRSLGWRPSAAMVRLFAIGLAAVIFTGIIGSRYPIISLFAGIPLVFGMLFHSLLRLVEIDALPDNVRRMLPLPIRTRFG